MATVYSTINGISWEQKTMEDLGDFIMADATISVNIGQASKNQRYRKSSSSYALSLGVHYVGFYPLVI